MEENDFDISVRKFNLYYNDFQALKNINKQKLYWKKA